MSITTERKAEEGIFLKKWKEDYLYLENNGKPLCLVCQKTILFVKEYNKKRHYDTLHIHKYEKYKRTKRKNVLQNLKSKQEKQVSTMFNFVSIKVLA